jgi:hypothetical protein
MQIASLNTYAEEIGQTSILFQINSNDWLLGNLQILLIQKSGDSQNFNLFYIVSSVFIVLLLTVGLSKRGLAE